ncbi:hypothetical protein RchiOBHm_Chr6g0250291 [Rosa chinensis]|uniref:Uncharacterized protein n=1 Tax=Rosa chinensis TaxID=74649 RepID=A0A2P6PKI8_ROSCH|nr:hypothetical protein RchiOBHm_Chr6g0250291 [Rosa chinensis]
MLDHIYLDYVHRDDAHCPEWQDIYYQLEFSFKTRLCYSSREMDEEIVQVKKCGVRMVYEEDAEELWQTLLKQSNTKSGLQQYYDNDAASSNSATGASREEEEKPHPKRFKGLELDGAGPG